MGVWIPSAYESGQLGTYIVCKKKIIPKWGVV